MLVFNFMFYLVWTDKGSSVTSVAFLRFRAIKNTEKHGYRPPSGNTSHNTNMYTMKYDLRARKFA